VLPQTLYDPRAGVGDSVSDNYLAVVVIQETKIMKSHKPEVSHGNNELSVLSDGSWLRRGCGEAVEMRRCLVCDAILTENEVDICEDCEEEERGCDTWRLLSR
jgi:hypothetical protein